MLSCSSGEDEAAFGELYLEKAQEQQARERVWKSVSLSKMFELPGDGEIVLYDPQYVIPDNNGDIYVVDYGTYEILRFDADGNYIMSYGDGVGRGPGEFISITSVEVAADSIIYVADPNGRRISSISKATGNFVDSRVFDAENVPFRYVVTDAGVGYIFRAQNNLFFESFFRGKSVEFGKLVEGHDLVSRLVADGMIETYKELMIYVPIRFPVIMVYDVNGTLVRAKKTMTFDGFEEPRLERYVMNGIESYRVEGDHVNGIISVVGDELLVQSRGDLKDLIVDVYEAGSAEYRYSFRIPDYVPSFITNDRIYQVTDDATVVVSSINISS